MAKMKHDSNRQAGAHSDVEEVCDSVKFGVGVWARGLSDDRVVQWPDSLEAEPECIFGRGALEHLRGGVTNATRVECKFTESGNEGVAVRLFGDLVHLRHV